MVMFKQQCMPAGSRQVPLLNLGKIISPGHEISEHAKESLSMPLPHQYHGLKGPCITGCWFSISVVWTSRMCSFGKYARRNQFLFLKQNDFLWTGVYITDIYLTICHKKQFNHIYLWQQLICNLCRSSNWKFSLPHPAWCYTNGQSTAFETVTSNL
jgi:hypothetical protein